MKEEQNKTQKQTILLTVNEAASELKTNKGYVYNLLNSGLLPYLKLGSKKIRRKTLEDFCEKYEGQDIDLVLSRVKEV